MRLINVKAFLEREELIREGKRVDRRAKVLEFADDEVTKYAILSHRWTEQEVDYNEIAELSKMDEEERTEIRQRDGYRKILQSCEQAKKDGYKWLWVDTCCIDKQSSAELSEAINSMYRWYENSRICYAYLYDVDYPSLPILKDHRRHPKSNGWPEWFSRGWTLQEMIAPRDVQFFNKDWHPIGDKRVHARTLSRITGVPQHILTEGLSSNRPCVAQIMSWAANRMTTRVEDRAYSLMGLLDENMPMLYGEGKKAFHRLQLEIIRMSNDQSIFAWGCHKTYVRTGSILADDPSFFEDCRRMELMDQDKFIQCLKERGVPRKELPSIEDDRFSTFPITNRGIHIWLFLRPDVGSNSVFQALLPCQFRPSGPPTPVAIDVALWDSNYYRYGRSLRHEWGRLQLCQVYLRYQDTLLHCNSTFEIDDSAITEGHFPPSSSTQWPVGLITGNTVTLSITDPLCIKHYSCVGRYRFTVGFGQCFGKNWIHADVCEGSETMAWNIYDLMLKRASVHTQAMDFGAASRQLCISQTRLYPSTWILQTSCVMWESPRIYGVKLEVFWDRDLGNVSGARWTGFDVDGTDDPDRDWRGLMMPYCPSKQGSYELLVDGVSVKFSCYVLNDIKLGDYGHFTDSESFCREGNLFTDLKSRFLKTNITPRQHKISGRYGYQTKNDVVTVDSDHRDLGSIKLYKPLGLSLPSNDDFKSLLVSFSTRLANRYLVTRVIECPPNPHQQKPCA